MLRRSVLALTLLVGLSLSQTAIAQSQNQPAPAAPANKNDYSDGKTWLCRPGQQDACAVDLTTTVVAADGKVRSATYSSGPIGRVDASDVVKLVNFYDKQAAQKK